MIRRYAARVVLRDGGGRVLLMHWRHAEKGTQWWATPGGGIEAGERAIDAARRELREECGIEPSGLEGPAWRSEHFFRSGADLFLQSEAFFVARVDGVEPEVDVTGLDGYEVDSYQGYRWWPVDELQTTRDRVFPTDLGSRLRAWDSGTPMPAQPRRRDRLP